LLRLEFERIPRGVAVPLAEFIDFLLQLDHAQFSTLLRLDDAAAILSLSEELNELRGFTLKQIGDMKFSARQNP